MLNRISILYAGSSLLSESLEKKIVTYKLAIPNLAALKFHRLFAQGISLNSDLYDLKVVGVPPIHNRNSRKFIYHFESEIEKGVTYSYLTIIKLPILRHIVNSFLMILNIVKWSLQNSKSEKIILFDILNLNISVSSIFTAKLFKIKLIPIVTDLPDMMFILKDRPRKSDILMAKLQNYLLSIVDGYVFLTQEMNTKMNAKNKPFMLMEGLVDIQMVNKNKNVLKGSDTMQKIILYSGGLFEKFGIRLLIDAFTRLEGEDYRLQLYGNGDMVDTIKEYVNKDNRISFFGYVENAVIVNAQMNATILVNPRLSSEEYTRYSFPSKNIEYMASGVPLLTTKLAGMPEEYFNYVYLFDNESVEGFKNTMQFLLNKPSNELSEFGAKAKEFVMTKKNNKIQAARFYFHFGSK